MQTPQQMSLKVSPLENRPGSPWHPRTHLTPRDLGAGDVEGKVTMPAF